jgi:hypothetical protein
MELHEREAELIAELQRAPQDANVIVDTDQGQKGAAWLILDCDTDENATS